MFAASSYCVLIADPRYLKLVTSTQLLFTTGVSSTSFSLFNTINLVFWTSIRRTHLFTICSIFHRKLLIRLQFTQMPTSSFSEVNLKILSMYIQNSTGERIHFRLISISFMLKLIYFSFIHYFDFRILILIMDNFDIFSFLVWRFYKFLYEVYTL